MLLRQVHAVKLCSEICKSLFGKPHTSVFCACNKSQKSSELIAKEMFSGGSSAEDDSNLFDLLESNEIFAGKFRMVCQDCSRSFSKPGDFYPNEIDYSKIIWDSEHQSDVAQNEVVIPPMTASSSLVQIPPSAPFPVAAIVSNNKRRAKASSSASDAAPTTRASKPADSPSTAEYSFSAGSTVDRRCVIYFFLILKYLNIFLSENETESMPSKVEAERRFSWMLCRTGCRSCAIKTFNCVMSSLSVCHTWRPRSCQSALCRTALSSSPSPPLLSILLWIAPPPRLLLLLQRPKC